MDKINSIYGKGMSSKSILLYNYLNGFSGQCYPSVGFISKQLNLSKATIYRAMRELENNGLIIREHRYRTNGSKSSNMYHVK